MGSDEGVQFPVDSEGNRSTTAPAKDVWCSAFESVAGEEQLASLKKDRQYRHTYSKHIFELTKKSVASPSSTIKVAQDGLNAVYRVFEFVRDGKTMTVPQAMSSIVACPSTGVIKSNGSQPLAKLNIPFDGQVLQGKDALEFVNNKIKVGEFEADVGVAFVDLDLNLKKWSALLKDTYFVLLGATSELCPFEKLVELGLNVVAVSRPSAARQKKLIDFVLESSSGATLTLPLLSSSDGDDPEILAATSGLDIITHTPEVQNWLLSLYPGKRMVIGSYIYLDGANHVRASIAMDAVINGVLEGRPNTDLMYLGSPAVAYPITRAAHEDSIARLTTVPFWHKVTGSVLGPYCRNVEDPIRAESINENAEDQSKDIFMFNGIMTVQGPNYLLAKTLQHWRAVLARELKHARVSVNMAPSCATDSVMHVAAVARGVRGMRAFPPLNYFEPNTAKSIMAYLMIYDMCSDVSAANPKIPLKNPMEIFASLGCHAGLWRAPYTAESISKTAYLMDLFNLV